MLTSLGAEGSSMAVKDDGLAGFEEMMGAVGCGARFNERVVLAS